ncbi:MAG: hypothetical protein WC912_08615 [Thermovirgaceae bacterium]|jgi:hypothetical protein
MIISGQVDSLTKRVKRVVMEAITFQDQAFLSSLVEAMAGRYKEIHIGDEEYKLNPEEDEI